MGFFGGTDPIREEVENATSEKNTSEEWGKIMDICDKAGKSSDQAKQYLRALYKRLYNADPHVGLKAVKVLDACVKNSGKTFHLEVASKEFETEFFKLMSKGHEKTAKELRICLQKWVENEFKSDEQLNLIPSLYSKLKNEKYDFSTDDKPVRRIPVSKDPNVVESNAEEAEIMKAIELSLKDVSASSSANTSSSLYPSTNLSSVNLPVNTQNSAPVKEPIKVRALYDFIAGEDNELTFNAGEIIFVIDKSDANWWKGSNQRGEGLFPANFVTEDLTVEPEQFVIEKAKKMVQFKESVDVKIEKETEVDIDENKIDRLLHLLHEADPTNPQHDTEEMLVLEREVNNMGPLIDSELERVDRKHAQLTQLSADLVEALSLYHTLMREPGVPSISKIPYGYSNTNYNGPQALSMMGVPPPSMGPPGAPTMDLNRPPAFSHPGAPMPNYSLHNMMPQQPHHLHNMPVSQPGPSGGHNIPPAMPPPNMMGSVPDTNMQYGIPNYSMPPGHMTPNFQMPAIASTQTVIPNGSQQPGPQFTSNTSSHMM